MRKQGKTVDDSVPVIGCEPEIISLMYILPRVS